VVLSSFAVADSS